MNKEVASSTGIGKYRLLRELGRGATSTVYLAEDPFNKRQVAIKRIHKHLLADERLAARYRRSLRNEAALAGQLRHPHIVSVYDADVEATPPYIVLEYIDGTSLSSFTAPDKLLPVSQVLDILYTCCSAMDYAHARGLVHRDLKPANLMLASNGDVKVTDFGTALKLQGDNTLTLGIVGSPMYMSPEQVREQPCSDRSDMFSLGVVLYELLTGRRPFEGDSDYATMFKITSQEPIPPSTLRPGLPPGIDALVLRALQKQPQHRFDGWQGFADAVLAVKRDIKSNDARHSDGEQFARLRKLPFFAQFPDQLLWETLRLGTILPHRAGATLMEEGSTGDAFCVLLEGKVSIVHQGWKVATLDQPGVTLGEMAYLKRDNRKRTATVVAETAGETLEIRNDALKRASEDLQLCFDKAFIELLLARLIATTEKLGSKEVDGLVIGGDSKMGDL